MDYRNNEAFPSLAECRKKLLSPALLSLLDDLRIDDARECDCCGRS
jgi:hypothetical protein